MESRPAAPSDRRTTWVWVVLVFALALAAYGPALTGEILWDDPAHIPRPEMQSVAGLKRMWTEVHATQQYYPILFSAFWVEHRLWGEATLGYHLTNVLLHATSSCLLALLLRRLWSDPAPAGAPGRLPTRRVPAGAGWFAALLFAVHPVCVESVAWMTEQKNTLSLVLYLLAAFTYLGFDAQRGWKRYAAASGFFLLALGSKTSGITLPAALLVLLWWKRGRLEWRRDVRPLVPWFVAVVPTGLFTSFVERTVVGADFVGYELSFLHRALLAGRIVWFYLAQLAWPAELNFFYPQWDVPAAGWRWIGYLVGAAAVTLVCWSVRQRSRGPLAVWLLFVGSLFPVLGFFKVYFFLFSYVNDHFVYLPCLAVIAGAAAGAARLGQLLGARVPWLGRAAAAAVVLVLAILTHRQSALYRDNETLFGSALALNPSSWMAHHILATTLAKSPERQDEAIAHYRAAIRMKPDYPDPYLGLGVALARRPGHEAEVIALYERAVALLPYYAEARNNLGFELAKQPGRADEAIAHFEMALRVKPNFAEAHFNLATVLASRPDRIGDAIEHYRAAVQARPDHLEALNRLGVLHARQERWTEARSCWERALALDPANRALRENLQLLDRLSPHR